jgi:uncharacterized phosphosugar-binding protein
MKRFFWFLLTAILLIPMSGQAQRRNNREQLPLEIFQPAADSIHAYMKNTKAVVYGRIVVDDYRIGEGDLLWVVNAYGINSATIDAALTAKARGAKVLGVCSVEHASTCPPDHPARHPSKKNLYEIVDCNVDCKVKMGDAVLEIEGLSQKIGALSTFANSYVMNCIVIEAVNMLVNEGIEPPIWRSGNCPGGDEWNSQFIAKFRDKVRCL